MGRRQSLDVTVLALWGALLAGLSAPGPASAQEQVSAPAQDEIAFDIPALSLADSLQVFSDQSGLQIAVFSADIEGVSAPPLQGRYTAGEAIRQLLAGSDLHPEFIGDRILAVAKPQANPVPVPAPAVPDLPAPEGQVLILPSVLVSGYRASYARASLMERQADQVVSVAASEDISRFPDQNVAEAAERLLGVQITRRNGEGETVQIRGLSADFTRLEIDGRRTSSSFQRADPSREAAMSIFAANLYDMIEIIKSPKASDVEGGIGGIVRLTTKDPFELDAPSYAVDIGISGGEFRSALQPQIQAYYSDIFHQDRLGLWLAGAYEERDLISERVENNRTWLPVGEDLLSNPVAQADLIGLRYPRRVRYLRQTGEARKYNLAGKLQFRPSSRLSAYLHGLYTDEQRDELRARLQVLFSDGFVFSGMPDADHDILARAEVDGALVEHAGFYRRLDIQTAGLSGGLDWTGETWTLSSSLNWSESREHLSESQAVHDGDGEGVIAYDILPGAYIPALSGAGAMAGLADLSVSELSHDQRQINVEESAFALEGTRRLEFGLLDRVETGLRLSSTRFSRRQGSQFVEDLEGLTFADGAPIAFSDPFLENQSGLIMHDWASVDPESLFAVAPPMGPFQYNDENLYDVREDGLALYGLADFRFNLGAHMRADGNIGLRLVKTWYDGEGVVDLAGDAIEDFGTVNIRSVQRSYVDLLPSFNLKLGFPAASNLELRLAASQIMARPDIEQIQPGEVVRIRDLTGMFPEDNTFESGNPGLDPYRADQYEIGLRWAIGGRAESLFQISAFAKDVENFVTTIERTREYGLVSGDETTTVLLYDDDYPVNGGKARVRGVEMGLQSPFFFLPEPWDSVGLATNYTYTDSDFRNANGQIQAFPGASEHAGSVVLFADHGPFSARAAYNYRSAYLIEAAQTEGGTANTIYEDDQARLDIGLRYRMTPRWRVSLDAQNLTDEDVYQYYDQQNRLAKYERNGRTFLLRLDYQY